MTDHQQLVQAAIAAIGAVGLAGPGVSVRARLSSLAGPVWRQSGSRQAGCRSPLSTSVGAGDAPVHPG